jgi:hypothetical protein
VAIRREEPINPTRKKIAGLVRKHFGVGASPFYSFEAAEDSWIKGRQLGSITRGFLCFRGEIGRFYDQKGRSLTVLPRCESRARKYEQAYLEEFGIGASILISRDIYKRPEEL